MNEYRWCGESSLWDALRSQLRLEDDDIVKVDMRATRHLMCGDCGVLPSNTNVCTGCGGYAQPYPNLQLLDRHLG